MNIKSKRFAVVLLTLVFAVSVFGVTAFAESVVSGPILPESQASVSTPVSSEEAPISSEPVEASSSTESSIVSSEPVQESSVASSSEAVASSSEAISSSQIETTTSSKYEPVVSNHTVDTHASRVEAVASQAAQAVSDPDVLSSQNWGELLSSGSQTQSQSAAAAATGTVDVSSTAAQASVGGVSMILILGVVLIVLALCGIGLFVYLQFFSNRDGGNSGPKVSINRSADIPKQDTDEPMTFTDISSDSDGTQHRDGYTPEDEHDIRSNSTPSETAPMKQAPKSQPAKKTTLSDNQDTAPIPQPILPTRKPAVPTQGIEPLSKSQATPVSESSDFNWEKFFNEQK